MAKYIVAHDVGTSNTKAVLVDVEGKVHGRVVRPYDIKYPKPGWAEQDPEDWWKAMTTSTKQLMTETGVSPADVLCVINSSQLIGIVPMDGAGTALRPGIIWLDSRAPEEARWVMNKFLGPAVFTAIAGASITGKDGIPKLLWIKKNEPDVYRRMKYFLDVSGYLNYRCSGRMYMSRSNASAFGLDLKKKNWMEMIFGYVGFDTRKLAPLCDSTDKIGGLTSEAASLMGLLEGTPVMGGTGDIQSAAVGSGAMGEGGGHISMGTSAWVGVVTKKILSGKSGVVSTQSADPGKILLLGQMELAGGCLRWLGDEMCRLEKADATMANIFGFMDTRVEQVPAGSDYLIFTPWMYGERAPVADAFIRSGFYNLTPEHTREHLIKAVYEGVAYNLRWIIEVVEKQFKFPLPSLRVIGGGALGHPWMQILADVTGKKIQPVHNPQEAGAVGAAMTAAVGLGIYKDFESLKDVVSPEFTFEPRTANREVYDFLYLRYKELYTDLKDFYTRINKERCEQV